MRMKKPAKGGIKAAADRAAARSEGKPIDEPKVPITPAITPAPVIVAVEREEKTKEKTKAKRRRKRTNYSPALGKAICTMLARGHTLTSICKRPLLPREDVVLRWAMNPTHPFSAHYARAREVGYNRMADQLLDIADNSVNDFMEKVGKDGEISIVVNREAMERTRLRIDTRKWLLAKALPKIYGDKVALEHAGKDGGPIETVERPQHPGDDHLSEITRRYAAKTPAASLNGHGPAKANGKANGSGLH